jgi:hypothetical protein
MKGERCGAMRQSQRNPAIAMLGTLVILGGAAGTARPAAGETAAPSAEKRLNAELLNHPPNAWVKIKPNRKPEARSF